MPRLRAPYQEAGAEHAPYLQIGSGKEGKEGPPGKEGKEGPPGPEGKEPTGAVLLAGRAGGQKILGVAGKTEPYIELIRPEEVPVINTLGAIYVHAGIEPGGITIEEGATFNIPEGAGEGKALVSTATGQAIWSDSFGITLLELLHLIVKGWAKITFLLTSRRVQLGGALMLSSNTPAEIKANQNNYRVGSEEEPFPATIIRLKSSAEFNITGLAKQGPYEESIEGEKADAQILILTNIGANTLNLINESALSTASNRFLTSTGANLKLEAKHSIRLYYDEASARWRDW